MVVHWRPSFGQVAGMPFGDIGNRFFDPGQVNISQKKRPLRSGYLGGFAVTGLLRDSLCNKTTLCCVGAIEDKGSIIIWIRLREGDSCGGRNS